MILSCAILEYLWHCEYERTLSPKTIKAYRIDLNQFRLFVGEAYGDLKIDAIKKDLLRKYLQHLLEAFQPRSAKRKVATLKAFFAHLEFQDIVLINPFRKMRIQIKNSDQLPRTMSRLHMRKLFKWAYRQKQDLEAINSTDGKYHSTIRDIAVLELLFATGVRVAELSHLKKEGIDLRRSCVRILGKGNKERLVPLCGAEVVDALAAYAKLFNIYKQKSSHFFINKFGDRLSEQSIRHMVCRYAKNAKLPIHVTPHMFRHTVATLLLENETDIRYIQTLLGHSSITTTQIYAKVNERAQRRVLMKKHPRRDLL